MLRLKVAALFEANNGEYGYRRLHQALARGGERCSPELVRRLMRELGLQSCQPRPALPAPGNQQPRWRRKFATVTSACEKPAGSDRGRASVTSPTGSRGGQPAP
jgi:hypothetical protein